MNESDLENELRSLRPIEPSPRLAAGIAAELQPRSIAIAESRTLRTRTSGVLLERRPGSELFVGWLRSLGWAAAGAAAAIAGVLYFHREPREAAQTAPAVAAVEPEGGDYLPAESESELLGADETGIVYVDGAEPFRQMRFLSVERYAWSNPETGARVEVEVPREDVVLMPVAMQ